MAASTLPTTRSGLYADPREDWLAQYTEEVIDPARPIVEECIKNRLLVNGTAGNVLRLLPPLNLTREEADAGLAVIENAFKSAPLPK